MPLARIVTKSLDESLPLQEELRARGFEVQAVAPEELFAEPADLEIQLEELSPEQALRKADEVARAEDLPVFISPASISDGLRPITVIPIVPEPATVVAEKATEAQDFAFAEENSEPEFEPEPHFEPEVEAPRPEEVETVHMAQAEAYSVPGVAEPVVPASLEQVQPEAEFSYSNPQRVEEAPQVEAVNEQEVSETPAAQKEDVEPVAAEEPVILAPEIQEMLPELEAVMPDMEAWAREEGPVSDWPIWQAGALDPLELQKAHALLEMPKRDEEPAQTFRKFKTNRFASERVFWKTAAWAAMVALSALVLGATVHRFAPVPARFAASNEVQNQTTQSTVAPVVTPEVIKPSASLKRTAAHEPRVHRTESVPKATPSAVNHSREQRRSSGQSDDFVAQDTTVRYGSKPPAPKVQAQMKADGIKRYTDLK